MANSKITSAVGQREDVTKNPLADGALSDVDTLISGEDPEPTFSRALTFLTAQDSTEAEEEVIEEEEVEDNMFLSLDEEGNPIFEDMEEEEEAEEVEAKEEAETEDEEAETEDEEEEIEAKEEAEDRVEVFLSSFREQFADLEVEDLDDISAALTLERQANDAMLNVFREYPQLGELVREIYGGIQAGNKVDLSDAARVHLGEFDELPDPVDDPDAYREAVRAQERRKIAEAKREEELRAVETRIAEMQDLGQKAFSKVKKTFGLSGKQAEKAQKEIQTFIDKPTEDFSLAIYRGLHFDSLLKDATEKARIEGRNEAIRERKAAQTKRGDGVAKIKSTSSPRTADGKPKGDPVAQELLSSFRRVRQGNPLSRVKFNN